MRILIVNPNASEGMTEKIRAVAEARKRDDCEVDVVCLKHGPVTLDGRLGLVDRGPLGEDALFLFIGHQLNHVEEVAVEDQLYVGLFVRVAEVLHELDEFRVVYEVFQWVDGSIGTETPVAEMQITQDQLDLLHGDGRAPAGRGRLARCRNGPPRTITV